MFPSFCPRPLRTQTRSLPSAAASMTWTLWSVPYPAPRPRLRPPSPPAQCRLFLPHLEQRPRGSSPTPTSSARSSMSWWRRRRPMSKWVFKYYYPQYVSQAGLHRLPSAGGGWCCNKIHINVQLPLTSSDPRLIFISFFCLFQDLSCLIECYLTPLQKESFLTQDEVPD